MNIAILQELREKYNIYVMYVRKIFQHKNRFVNRYQFNLSYFN